MQIRRGISVLTHLFKNLNKSSIYNNFSSDGEVLYLYIPLYVPWYTEVMIILQMSIQEY